MKLQKLNWKGISSDERHKSLEAVKKKIAGEGGFITHFNMFSDLATSLTIEIEERSIESLYKSLEGILSMPEFTNNGYRPDSDREWVVFLNLSFSKGTGTMRHSVPQVPG